MVRINLETGMRRGTFVQLTEMTDEAFNLLRARKLLPLRGQKHAKGWQEYSVEDALALEIAQALNRKGVRKADARDWVDLYFEPALEYARDPGRAKGDPILLGAAEIVHLADGRVRHDHYRELVGTASEIADQLRLAREQLSPPFAVEGHLAVDIGLCLRALQQRAERAGIDEPRLQELSAWLQ